ncbi:FecR domain-containing protein [Azomonas macrocytogenes]|uniref:Transmembrane sensor n=1 Tax=Azomonas macrocytogenes TaxID=69962 RepID=A0A839T0G2_AZOMA|nr:FecR domain-containing protein [Azomonas macrocytogenes]MBB3103057.1 transmembrane sensor [Azomonas macrocytogenes]
MPTDRQRAALRMAAHWYAVLGASTREEDRLAWHEWHAQAPENQWAWQRLENLQQQLQGLPGNLAFQTISSEWGRDRRTVLKGLVLLAGGSTLAWTARQNLPWQPWVADQRSAIGERRSLTLADGSRLHLNTASAVDIRFDAQQRLIELQAGEIQVETVPDPARPFLVATRDGLIRALGTRFTVRQRKAFTEVGVLQHAVAVTLKQTPQPDTLVQAGQCLAFDASHTQPLRPLDPLASEWTNGRLVIDGWRLADTLEELSRYRPGLLSCDSSIADLRLSGAYPLDDTDQALAAIVRALPVHIVSLTRYWVRLVPIG